jgi:lycopene cyclase domain-containing protein
MTTWAYLLALLVSLTGMVVLDWRFTLFFWAHWRRATVVLVAGLAFFVAWDLAGIDAGVFFRGASPFITGIQIAPELPLEEVFFLTLLCYLTMNLFEFAGRAISGWNSRASTRHNGQDAR